MASDKLYVNNDIPLDYHYAQISSNYVTYYNKPSAQNETLDYYRVYYDLGDGVYTTGTTTFSNYNRTYFVDLETSHSMFARSDIGLILTSCLILAVFFLFLCNVITSIFRSGGVLGGLL